MSELVMTSKHNSGQRCVESKWSRSEHQENCHFCNDGLVNFPDM